MTAPFHSLDGGRMAIVADPAGAVLGLWQPGAHRGAQRVNEPSAYAMSLLHTPDTAAAAAFYADLFGWTTEAFGPATMFRLPGFVGGEPTQPVPRDVVAVMAPGEPARWAVDFWIADADGAAPTRARAGWDGRGRPLRRAAVPRGRARRPRRGDVLGQHPAAGPARLAGAEQLLDGPAVAVGVGEEHEPAPGELLDLADLDPAAGELGVGGVGILDHDLQAADGAGRGVGDALSRSRSSRPSRAA